MCYGATTKAQKVADNMTSPTDVNPEAKWSEIWLLFDNGEYSVISGMYQGDSRRRLAQRWNGHMPDHPDRLLGFPINEQGRADWCLVPEFLEIPILHALLDELLEHPGIQINCARLTFKELERCRAPKGS